MPRFEPDEFFSLRAAFYIGSFEAAVREAASVVADTPELVELRDSFVARSRLAASGSLRTSSGAGEAPWRRLLPLLQRSASLARPSDDLDAIAAADAADNVVVRIVAALVYERCGSWKSALQLIHGGAALEELALAAQIYIKMDRVDLAQKQLSKMQSRDEDDPLSIVMDAAVSATRGGADAAQRGVTAVTDLLQRFGETPTLLELRGAALMKLGKYTEALAAFKKARAMARAQGDGGRASAGVLVNTLVCLQHLRAALPKADDIRQRIHGELQATFPDDAFLHDQRELADFFDQAAARVY